MVQQPAVVRGVLLFHHLPSGRSAVSHLDLMIEAEGDRAGRLWCWSWEDWPATGVSLSVVTKPLHRAEYLSYEGEVSGGRGSVHRLAEGAVRWGDRSRSMWCCQLEFDQLAAKLELPCPELVMDSPAGLAGDPHASCWRVAEWSASDALNDRWRELRGC